MTTNRIFPIASIGIAAVATILLIVVASTPSYIKSNIENVGAFRQCMAIPIQAGAGFSSRSHSRTFHMLQNLPPGFPRGPINIPGNGGSIPVPGIPGGTITVDPIPIGGGGGGSGNSGSSTPGSSTPTTCDSLPTCTDLCARRNLGCDQLNTWNIICRNNPSDPKCGLSGIGRPATQAPITNPNTNRDPRISAQNGYYSGDQICDTSTSMCQDCSKINAIRAFLILAILSAGATIAIGIVLLISSSAAPSMYIIGGCVAGAPAIAALISMSLVISLKVQMQNDRSYFWGEYTLDYGFVLHVIAAVGMCIDAILLLVTKMRATYTYNNNNKVVQMNTNGTQMTTSPLHV